jgi:WD40 repeat protein
MLPPKPYVVKDVSIHDAIRHMADLYDVHVGAVIRLEDGYYHMPQFLPQPINDPSLPNMTTSIITDKRLPLRDTLQKICSTYLGYKYEILDDIVNVIPIRPTLFELPIYDLDPDTGFQQYLSQHYGAFFAQPIFEMCPVTDVLQSLRKRTFKSRRTSETDDADRHYKQTTYREFLNQSVCATQFGCWMACRNGSSTAVNTATNEEKEAPAYEVYGFDFYTLDTMSDQQLLRYLFDGQEEYEDWVVQKEVLSRIDHILPAYLEEFQKANIKQSDLDTFWSSFGALENAPGVPSKHIEALAATALQVLIEHKDAQISSGVPYSIVLIDHPALLHLLPALAKHSDELSKSCERASRVFAKLPDPPKPNVSFADRKGPISSAIFLNDENVITGGPCDAVVWDAKTGKEKARLEGHNWCIESIRPLNDTSIITASLDRRIAVWDFNNTKPTTQPYRNLEEDYFPWQERGIMRPTEVMYTPGYVYSMDYEKHGALAYLAGPKKCIVTDLDYHRFQKTFDAGERSFSSVAMSHKYLVLASWDSHLRIYDTSTWELLKDFNIEEPFLSQLAISPYDPIVVYSSQRAGVVIFNIKTGQSQKLEGIRGGVIPIAFDVLGNYLAIVHNPEPFEGPFDNKFSLSIFDAESLKEVSRIRTPEAWPSSVCFSPDGTRVLIAGMHGAFLYNLPLP